jgi:tetratricopeptide (TPR) repeat protein
MGIGRAARLGRLGEGYLLAGRVREAGERANEALALARSRRERDNEAWALRLLGAIAGEGDRPRLDVATGHYREALALAAQCGARPLIAHSQLGLGQIRDRVGDSATARAHLRIATAMYGEMGMRLWLERAERACAGTASPSPA